MCSRWSVGRKYKWMARILECVRVEYFEVPPGPSDTISEKNNAVARMAPITQCGGGVSRLSAFRVTDYVGRDDGGQTALFSSHPKSPIVRKLQSMIYRSSNSSATASSAGTSSPLKVPTISRSGDALMSEARANEIAARDCSTRACCCPAVATAVCNSLMASSGCPGPRRSRHSPRRRWISGMNTRRLVGCKLHRHRLAEFSP